MPFLPLPLPLPFLPLPREKAPMSVGVKQAEALTALVQVYPTYQLRAHEHVSLDGAPRNIGEPDPGAKVFRENLLRLFLVGLDHAFPRERLVLEVSRQGSVGQVHELIRCSLMELQPSLCTFSTG